MDTNPLNWSGVLYTQREPVVYLQIDQEKVSRARKINLRLIVSPGSNGSGRGSLSWLPSHL